MEQEQFVTWQSIIRGLPRNILAFAARLATDSLPSPSNLKKWGERVISTYPLCLCPKRILAHIINFWPVSLNQGRYTRRHDNVLNHIYNKVKAKATTDIEMYSDLPGKRINNSTIPQDIIVTNGLGSNPDLFIISGNTMNIAVFELTYPLNRNLHKVHSYKIDKYPDLYRYRSKGQRLDRPFSALWSQFTRPYSETHIFNTLKHFKIKFRTHPKLIKNLSNLSLLCTFTVFHAFQTLMQKLNKLSCSWKQESKSCITVMSGL